MMKESNKSDLSFSEILSEIKGIFTANGFFSAPLIQQVYAVISYYVTPVFLGARLSANFITFLKLLIMIIGAILIATGNAVGFFLGIVIFAMATLLDHIDGRVARATNTATFFGKFYDGLVDILIAFLFKLALTACIYNRVGSNWLFYIAAFSVFIEPFNHFLYDRYSAYARWINLEKGTNIKPYIRVNYLLKPANIAYDIEQVALVYSLFHFSQGMWIFFLIGLIINISNMTYHMRSAYINMRIKN